MALPMAVFAAVLFILTLSAPSAAATRTWTGGGAPSDVWSNPGNWDANAIPVDGDDLVFPNDTGATTTNDLPNLLVQSLTIASSRTFSGAGIRLRNGIMVTGLGAGGVTATLDLPIQLVAPQTWTLDAFTTLRTLANGTIDQVNARLRLSTLSAPQQSTVDLTGIISGLSFGSGTLHLRGANTFQGAAELGGGLVHLHHASALGVGYGTAENGTRVLGGAALYLPDGALAPEAIQLGISASSTGGFLFGCQNGASSIITGPVTLGPLPLAPNAFTGSIVCEATGILRIEGVISGPGRLGLSRGTIILALVDETFGALVTSTRPIAVERAMYSNAPGQPIWAAGTSATAVRLQ